MTIEKALSVREAYYKQYPQEEDYMEGMRHNILIDYLKHLLSWYYRAAQVTITSDLPFMLGNVQAAPDVAVVKGIYLTDQQIDELDSWRISPPNRPTPAVAFEISSKTTWPIDVGDGITDKPYRYAQLGVREYYAYDPVGYWNANVQLRVWEFVNGQMVERPLDPQGRFWSAELNCYLVPDGRYLRLYTAEGNRLLTKEEDEARLRALAEQRAKQEAQLRAQSELERAQSEQRAQSEAQLREQAERAAQAEAERAAQAEAEIAKLKAELEALKKAQLPADNQNSNS